MATPGAIIGTIGGPRSAAGLRRNVGGAPLAGYPPRAFGLGMTYAPAPPGGPINGGGIWPRVIGANAILPGVVGTAALIFGVVAAAGAEALSSFVGTNDLALAFSIAFSRCGEGALASVGTEEVSTLLGDCSLDICAADFFPAFLLFLVLLCWIDVCVGFRGEELGALAKIKFCSASEIFASRIFTFAQKTVDK
jgi:hypothetical protein